MNPDHTYAEMDQISKISQEISKDPPASIPAVTMVVPTYKDVYLRFSLGAATR